MDNTNKKSKIHPDIRDVWIVARVAQMTIGFHLGLYLYTYGVFAYESFGGANNPSALQLTAIVFIIGNAVMFLSDVPMGALADYLGRKKTIVATFLFRALFFFLLAWVPFVSSTRSAFILAAAAYASFGIGYTLYSGSFVAWVADTLRERNHPEGLGIILGRSYGHMALAQIIGAAIGLPLYLHGYIFYAFAVGFTSSILCALFCTIIMKETKGLNFHHGKLSWKHSAQRMKTIMMDGFKITIQTPAVTYLMMMYASFMFLQHVIAYFWPVAMKANFGVGKMSPYWYFIVFSGLGLMFLGSKMMEWVSHFKRTAGNENKSNNAVIWLWFVLIAFVMSVPIFYLGLKTNQGNTSLPLFMTAVVLSKFGYGFLRPCYETLVNHYIPPEHSQKRATVMSFAGMLVSAMVIVLMIPSAGKSGEATTVGWLVPSGILFCLTVVLHFLMRRYQKSIGEIPASLEKIQEVV